MCKALGIGPREKHMVSVGCGQVSCRAGVECSWGATTVGERESVQGRRLQK